MIIEEKAPAKINLGLRILGRRNDGYHDILSVFQTVDLCDDLRLRRSEETRLVCSGDDVPLDRGNLVLMAEECLRRRTGIQASVEFLLEKRIPVGAGLGGGSSDAAAALRALRRLHGGVIRDSVLHECARELGSDVPFLVRGGTAVVGGRGERVGFVEWPFDFTYVVVYPGFGVSTAWAYGSLSGFHDDGGEYAETVKRLESGHLSAEDFFRSLRNDFEPTVFGAYPALEGIKTALMQHGARAALLSGSGSSVFGIFDDDDAASRSARLLGEDFDAVFAVKALESAAGGHGRCVTRNISRAFFCLTRLWKPRSPAGISGFSPTVSSTLRSPTL